MATRELMDLEWLSPRKAWDHEALDFTPWLAENLHHVASEIGVDLELEKTEVTVNGLRADIVARDPRDDTRVLIENQLERADLHHLGQVLAYLAGLDARVVVWVAARFDEAHLSALRWLNEHSSDEFAFFAIRIRAARIGDSALAPVFETLERPNEWTRRVHDVARPGLSELGRFRREFWAHYESRFPGSIRSGFSGSNVYKSVEESDRRVCRYLAKDQVGVYYKLLRGESSLQRLEALEPCMNLLRSRLDSEGKEEVPQGWPGMTRSFDTANRANWDDMADWLHMRGEQWAAALRESLEPGD